MGVFVIKTRLAAGESPESCLSSFPAAATKQARIDAQISYRGPADLAATLATILEWEAVVGSLSKNGSNYRTVKCMTFALLVAEDPKNRGKTKLFDSLATYTPGAPDDTVPLFMFTDLLFYANYKKHTNGTNLVYLLGKSAFGTRRK